MRTILAALLGLSALALPLSAHAETPAKRTFEVEAIKDVAYYDGKDAHPVKHKLDLFLPKDLKDFPVLLFVHGGSWRHGDKDFLGGVYGNIGRFFAQQGIGAVVINYRLSPAVQHPEHIKDVARAFAWAHKNLPRYGGRADQIFIFGHSAGGHLVALLATDESYLKAEGLTPRDIRGVIAMSGVYEVPQRLFAQVFGADPEARKQASPLHHAKGGLAPFLILYADKDFPGCDKAPSEAFATALKDKGNSVKTVEVANSNHYQIILSAGVAEQPVSQAILSFITTQVGKPFTPNPSPQRGEGGSGTPTKNPSAQPQRDPSPQPPPRSGEGEKKESTKDEQAIVETLDVRYHDQSERQKLDVFAPKDAKNCPVVLFVHGGGWIAGDKNMLGLYRGVGRFLAKHGIVAVLPNYRLSPAVKHPEHVKDIARAFAWARRHAAEYGGDPDHIFLAGHSAGAHLVALLATDPSYLQAKDLKLTDRDRAALQGVIAISGVYRIPDETEFREMVPELVDALHEMSGRNAYLATMLPLLVQVGKGVNLFNIVFGTDKDVRQQAAPLAHVHKGLPPFLVLHGERDVPGLPAMASEFRDALQKAGAPVELEEIEDHGHNSIVFRLNQPNDPAAQAILKFIHRVLKEKAQEGRSVTSPARVGRLAPSPTGAQHVGNARTYLIAWLHARSAGLPAGGQSPHGRQAGGRVVLRIEDIDSPRVKEQAAEQALDDLRWLGLDWDEGPIIQTQRLDHYRAALARLQEQELVYPCTCTRSDVERAASAPHLDHEGPVYPGTCAGRRVADAAGLGDRPWCWRFRLGGRAPAFVDGFRGPTQVEPETLGGDFVVWKAARPSVPATPAYQLAVVVDDAAQGITEVIRGDDLVPSTPRQLLLYQALGLTPPRFCHVPLVVGPDGRRLAKRHGDTRLAALRQAGVRAESLLGLLAWSCGWIEHIEPISAGELIPLFRLESIPPVPFVLMPDVLAEIGFAR